MRALYLTGPNELKLSDIPKPIPGYAGQVVSPFEPHVSKRGYSHKGWYINQGQVNPLLLARNRCHGQIFVEECRLQLALYIFGQQKSLPIPLSITS